MDILRFSMGKKIWLCMNSKNFGSEKIVLVRPPLHVSQSKILHFKHPCVSAVNCMATRTRKRNNDKPCPSFD